jgi:hypothetical protein
MTEKSPVGTVALAVVAAMIFMTADQPATAQSDTVRVSNLVWMSGCWVANEQGPEDFDAEHWTRPMGAMFGINRSVRAGRVSFYEYLRIEQSAGEIYFVARPAGAERETSFRLTESGESTVVFENPEHDFPNRIEYSRPEPGHLRARVSSGERGFEILFRRASCDRP